MNILKIFCEFSNMHINQGTLRVQRPPAFRQRSISRMSSFSQTLCTGKLMRLMPDRFPANRDGTCAGDAFYRTSLSFFSILPHAVFCF